MPISILHVDDSLLFLDAMREALENSADLLGETFAVTSVTTAVDFIKELDQNSFDIALIDISLSSNTTDQEGLRLIPHVLRYAPTTLILMQSSDFDKARVRASRSLGAYDFIAKSSSMTGMAFQIAQSYRGFVKARHLEDKALAHPGAIGASMRKIAARIPLLIDSAVTAIHIYGPSGSGKEVVADLFNKALPPSTPFLRLNCGSLTESLAAAELFGHMKGAFTGAVDSKPGLIEAASGGFVFLDEIATLSETSQIALLRVLENKTVRRIGDVKDRSVDVKIISATNESLPELVEKGRFRRDLWQRLCEATIELKPLAERAEEVDELINFFLDNLYGGPYSLDPGARSILKEYDWKDGNIRELRNCLRAMTELRVGNILTTRSIPHRIFVRETTPPKTEPKNSLTLTWDCEDPPPLEELRGQILIGLLNLYRKKYGAGSMRHFAKSIGLSRSGLVSQLEVLVKKGKLSREEIDKFSGSKVV